MYYYVVKVFLIAIVVYILFSKMGELTRDAELTPSYGTAHVIVSNKLHIIEMPWLV